MLILINTRCCHSILQIWVLLKIAFLFTYLKSIFWNVIFFATGLTTPNTWLYNGTFLRTEMLTADLYCINGVKKKIFSSQTPKGFTTFNLNTLQQNSSLNYVNFLRMKNRILQPQNSYFNNINFLQMKNWCSFLMIICMCWCFTSQSTILRSYWDVFPSSWVEPVLSRG